MTAQYFARRTFQWYERMRGPFPTYTAAMDDHARHAAMTTLSLPGETQVLLNLGSISATDDLSELLRTDPVLKMVFELGRRMGAEAERNRMTLGDPRRPSGVDAAAMAEAESKLLECRAAVEGSGLLW